MDTLSARASGPSGRRPLRLATRLLIPLLTAVAGIMIGFALWALVQRERILVGEARRETQAYATALGLALDAAFRDPDRSGVPAIVDRITRQPSIYAVLVYDRDGKALFRPDTVELGPPPSAVGSVLATGLPTELERAIGDVDVYSVLQPILGEGGAVVGAFEVAQPLSFVEQEKARTRSRFLLNTVVLIAAVTVLIQWLVRRLVSDPLASFEEGVRAFGTGRLDHRIHLDTSIGELDAVAAEFNRMASSLEVARSDLVRGAEERLSLERHVRQAEKMAVIGQLAAGLAHEIGAPLHVIRGRADLLAKRTAGGEAESRALRIIVEQIDRITGIVRSLLDFARTREPRMVAVELGSVVDAVVELVSSETSRRGIEVSKARLTTARVLGDRDQLQQVVLNLLLNAVHALQDVDGRRSITLEIRDDAWAPGALSLRVTDSGPGIPVALRERVFEPFFTTKTDGAGTGLGLAMARRIVEEHGGTVSIEDPPTHRGTTVVVRLSAHEGDVGGP
jgi:signal transduction histidine kinase